MDPFEEFEFKPITEGLGFKNKKKPQSLDFIETTDEKNLFTQPLPRKSIPKESLLTLDKTVDDILLDLQNKQKNNFPNKETNLSQNYSTQQLKSVAPKIGPLVLDFMLIVSATFLCLIIALYSTRIDLLANLTSPDENFMIYWSTAFLFWFVAFTYMLIHRVFLGYTPGEWAYDMQLGKPTEQSTAKYTLNVTKRFLLNSLTGFAILPTLSWILKKDLAGYLSGVSLSQRV